jgi:hypothetical protein
MLKPVVCCPGYVFNGLNGKIKKIAQESKIMATLFHK